MKKTFVKVFLEIDENGKKTPKTIVFDDKEFNIDRVMDCKNCVSMKVGGVGERYTIRIKDNITYLFYENGKWFVEEKRS